MNKLQIDVKRRTFIAAAACAPAIALGVVLTREQGIEAAVFPLDDDAPSGNGYHETEHIRNYYRSAGY